MTWLDLLAFLLIALAAIDGAKTGLAWALIEFVFLFAAALLTGALRSFTEPYVLKVAVIDAAELPWVTHAVLFALLACVFMGIAFLLHPVAKKWRFRSDRWLGAFAGTLNGALAGLVLFSLAIWNSPRPYESELAPSVTGNVLVTLHDGGLTQIFPEGLGDRLDDLRTP